MAILLVELMLNLLLVIAAQELPVPLILKDTAMIATQDSQSASEEDGHDDDISKTMMQIMVSFQSKMFMCKESLWWIPQTQVF